MKILREIIKGLLYCLGLMEILFIYILFKHIKQINFYDSEVVIVVTMIVVGFLLIYFLIKYFKEIEEDQKLPNDVGKS